MILKYNPLKLSASFLAFIFLFTNLQILPAMAQANIADRDPVSLTIQNPSTPVINESQSNNGQTNVLDSNSINNAVIKSALKESDSSSVSVASSLISLPPGAVLPNIKIANEQPIVIDNDEPEDRLETIENVELPTDEGNTKVKLGARFPVVLISEISSKTAAKGDLLQGRLKYDLKIGDRLIAKQGSIVNGHISYALKARTGLNSLVSTERWYRNSGCLGVCFDEIINEKGEHLPLHAQPARAARIIKNKGEGRELGVNHNGQITGPWAQQLRYGAVRVGLNLALAPAGVFSFGAMPVALGILGAANPSFAFSKPVGLNVRHRRLKGFAWGFLSGVPGSFFIEQTTIKGQEAIIKPGDELYAEFVEEFTGEPGTSAELLPNATTKLHGQVLTDLKKKKK